MAMLCALSMVQQARFERSGGIKFILLLMGLQIRFPDSITSYFTDMCNKGGIESSFVWMQQSLGHVP